MARDCITNDAPKTWTPRLGGSALVCCVALLAGAAPPPTARAAGYIAKVQMYQMGFAYFSDPTLSAQNKLFGKAFGGNLNGFFYVNFNRDVNQNIVGGTWIWAVFSGKAYVGSLLGVITTGVIGEPPPKAGVFPVTQAAMQLVVTSGVGRFGTKPGAGAVDLIVIVDDTVGAATGGGIPYQVIYAQGLVTLQTKSFGAFAFD